MAIAVPSVPSGMVPKLDCLVCPTRRQAEWCVLQDQEMDAVNASKLTLHYRRGQSLYQQGDPCTGIHCVASGTVAVRKEGYEGLSTLVGLGHAGQTLGYRNYVGTGTCTTSAYALTFSVVCHIERPVLRKLLTRRQALVQRFQAHVAADLDAAEELILERTLLPVRPRVAHLLLSLLQRYGEPPGNGGQVIQLPISRKDMAALLGTTPESVARTLQAMDGDGVLSFSGRQVTVADRDALRAEVRAG